VADALLITMAMSMPSHQFPPLSLAVAVLLSSGWAATGSDWLNG
jgi:hypothetical protein